MYVKLRFEDPFKISMHSPRDKLKMTVIDPQLLLTMDSFIRVRDKSSSLKSIPPQVLESQALEVLKQGTDVA